MAPGDVTSGRSWCDPDQDEEGRRRRITGLTSVVPDRGEGIEDAGALERV